MRSTRGWWSATSCLVSFDYDALQKIRLGQVFDEIADPSGRAKTFHSCGRLARTEVNMLECTPERLRAHPASMRAWLTLELARDATTAAQRQDRIVLAPRAERCIFMSSRGDRRRKAASRQECPRQGGGVQEAVRRGQEALGKGGPMGEGAGACVGFGEWHLMSCSNGSGTQKAQSGRALPP